MDATLRDRAIDQAYRDHAPDVYRVAFGVLRDPDDALDATHDAFARAWERWEQYDSQRPLQAWLHGIVVHVALDQLRRRRVRRLAVPIIGGHAVAEVGIARTVDPATDVVRRRVIDEALDSLRPQARAVLVLRHYYGYDYAQIGAYLGLNSGTVGSILSRAHAELRTRLQPDDRAATRSGEPSPDGRPRSNHRAVDRPEPPEVLP
ncbi:MAG: sigma-70 family RNA polymerase sigma factor [Chloroflexi bacterium]|nr:sigma-70 family RNA polymerase sigma factor [Chloroflexota bacterium]